MALYSGVTGKISTKTGTAETESDLLHMATWDVSLTKSMIEVTSFGNDYKEKVPSVKDWSAKADGTTDFSADSGQAALIDAYENGAEIAAAFYLDEDTFLSGKCYITDLDITHDAEGASKISISLAGSGKASLTKPTE